MYLLCHQNNNLMEKTLISIPDQIKVALDGRTQRWLSFEVRIAEAELSKKMNSVFEFTPDELTKIQDRLKFKIIK